MVNKIHPTSSLKPNELEAVYAISSIVAQTIDIDDALDQITKIAREVFIFDNAIVYQVEEGEKGEELEPFFARAIGRGRSMAANLAWGDMAALEAVKTGEVYIREAEFIPDGDRLDQDSFLGLPMLIGGNITGALVFIRYGGPTYLNDQITLAEFITTNVSRLFEHQRLVERIANLEAERRLVQMHDDFIGMVSHELNTPLGFIKGYTTTLLRQDTEWDEKTQREFLIIIDDEADRLSELITNLMDSYRLKSGTLEMKIKPVILDTFFQQLLEQFNTTGIILDIQIDVIPSDLTAMFDIKRLNQVFDNLINNANKYAPNSTVSIQAYPEGDIVHISITDNGPGIPEHHLKHLFNRFYRVPERSAGVRGTGLGLYICQQIIQSNNGSISVESTLNQGTTFHIHLPISEAKVSSQEVKK